MNKKFIKLSGVKIPMSAIYELSNAACELADAVYDSGVCDDYYPRLAKKFYKGEYDKEKAINGYYTRVACYVRHFYGVYNKVFTPSEKYTAAVILAEKYEDIFRLGLEGND